MIKDNREQSTTACLVLMMISLRSLSGVSVPGETETRIETESERKAGYNQIYQESEVGQLWFLIWFFVAPLIIADDGCRWDMWEKWWRGEGEAGEDLLGCLVPILDP